MAVFEPIVPCPKIELNVTSLQLLLKAIDIILLNKTKLASLNRLTFECAKKRANLCFVCEDYVMRDKEKKESSDLKYLKYNIEMDFWIRSKNLYIECHRFRLMKRDDYF